MDTSRRVGGVAFLAGVAGLAAAGWAATAAVIWARYGCVAAPRAEESDPLLDAFMANYEVVERHHIAVAAPADVTLAAAREMNLMDAPIVRAISRAENCCSGPTQTTNDALRGYSPSLSR
jgi:hypothetical protein